MYPCVSAYMHNAHKNRCTHRTGEHNPRCYREPTHASCFSLLASHGSVASPPTVANGGAHGSVGGDDSVADYQVLVPRLSHMGPTPRPPSMESEVDRQTQRYFFDCPLSAYGGAQTPRPRPLRTKAEGPSCANAAKCC